LAHANVTLVPFHLGETSAAATVVPFVPATTKAVASSGAPARAPRGGGELTPIGLVRFRDRVTVEGTVRVMRVQPHGETPSLECVLADDTGQLSVVFLGRRQIPGIAVGARMSVEGMVGEFRGRLCFLNPSYALR
jgi:hypothetical protein